LAIAHTPRIQITLARLGQSPSNAGQQGRRDSRGWLETGGWLDTSRAHVLELRLRAVHDDGADRMVCDSGQVRML